MNSLETALTAILDAQVGSGNPLAVVLTGHNGSGKSTLWYETLAPKLQIPLVNADRMMLSILPEPSPTGALPQWASDLRDSDDSWMRVAQKGVQAFVAQAMGQKVPFATETVFSHIRHDAKGVVTESKVDLVREMKAAGYFVLLVFVGLSNVTVSIGRVLSRKAQGGHGVPQDKLEARFPRTQQVMRLAMPVADAAILLDNSRRVQDAFTVCRVQLGESGLFDIRTKDEPVPREIQEWLPLVSPLI